MGAFWAFWDRKGGFETPGNPVRPQAVRSSFADDLNVRRTGPQLGSCSIESSADPGIGLPIRNESPRGCCMEYPFFEEKYGQKTADGEFRITLIFIKKPTVSSKKRQKSPSFTQKTN